VTEAPIRVDHLTRDYGKRRGITDLTFQVEEGEIFGFLGPNGAGKTTTIRQLMGLMRPGGGSARVFGLDCWRDSTRAKELVGFLPGDIRLYEKMTGEAFLDFFAAFRKVPHRRWRRELVERLGLDTGQKIKHMSKGNRQKLAVVQALMHDAPLLILDEPSSGLDPLMQVEFVELLREEQSRGKTVFLSSHQLVEVERIAHRVAIIREGELVAVEEVDRLKKVRERRMDVILHEPAPSERLSSLEGVRVVSEHHGGRQLELAVRGKLGPLLRALGEMEVDDLSFAQPDLESVFLHYYEKDGNEKPAADPMAEVGR
jgi:ABC-2 type transport system ATP-binding protein